jgi:SAM-dependent methyltransferase
VGQTRAMKRKALRKDFDTDEVKAVKIDIPAMWSDEAYEQFGEPSDVHADVAARLDAEEPRSVLDIGCGTGALRSVLRAPCFGVDRSVEQLRQGSGPAVVGDALSLPFADETFDAAATLYTLYFFEDPSAVAAEAFRVLRPGGLFATCSPSIHDSPEIGGLAENPDEGAFASEDIRELLEERFEDVEITEWNFPFLELKNFEQARDYIRFFYFPVLSLEEAAEIARGLVLPQKITKIGAWGVGRKPR